MNTNINILFYSRQCKTCENLMRLLQNENLLDIFRLICVDNQLDTLPSFIKKVPTLLVSTNKQPLTDGNIYKWIETMKFMKQKKEDNKNIVEYNINKSQNQNQNGPRAYLIQEMDGFSDTFAYTKCDNAIPHRFYDYNNETAEKIFTAPEQNKINDDILHKKLKDYTAQRKDQEEKITGIYQQQIQSILINKNILMQPK